MSENGIKISTNLILKIQFFNLNYFWFYKFWENRDKFLNFLTKLFLYLSQKVILKISTIIYSWIIFATSVYLINAVDFTLLIKNDNENAKVNSDCLKMAIYLAA